MCSHYHGVTDHLRMQQAFAVRLPMGGKADVWPTYPAAFVVASDDGEVEGGEVGGSGEDGARNPMVTKTTRVAKVGQFGLLPHWAKDVGFGRRTYNARSETAAEKPSFRDAWRKGQRCIVPAEAIFEADWRSGKAVATRIVRSDGLPMGIAGLWSQAGAGLGAQLSFTMLTVNADTHALMRGFHKPDDEKRMVVILPMGLYSDWLDPKNNPREFMRQYPADRLAVANLPAADSLF